MNAMMWVRGFAADYDEWGALAGEDWDFAHVSKYFAKIEAGPLVISPQRSPRSSTAAWLTAVRECGYDIDNPNCDAPEGFCETLVTQRRGARWSTADAYLKPALRRPNLTLQTEATATKVLFDGRRAVGVEFSQLGQRRVVRARREVVLAGGAVNTPQLLMLSGIGDREQLARHGIDVVADVPEVGQNMMDHLAVPLGFDVPDDSLYAAEKPLELLNYLFRRRGMLTSNVGEAYGFVRSRPDLDVPDLELIFAPAPFFEEGIGDPHDGHAVAMGPILVKPRSRGHITLRFGGPARQADHRSAVPQRRCGGGPRRVDLGTADERANRSVTRAERRCSAGLPVRSAQRNSTTRRMSGRSTSARRRSTTPQGPAGWAATTRAWWIRSCGSAVSTDCGWPMPR